MTNEPLEEVQPTDEPTVEVAPPVAEKPPVKPKRKYKKRKPVSKKAVIEKQQPKNEPLISILDDDGELKSPSLIKKEFAKGWGRLKQKALEAATGPLKKAGQGAAVDTLTRLFGSLDGAIDGMEPGSKKPEKDDDDDSTVASKS
jgi:outer membrane biosynthesis protein TonB